MPARKKPRPFPSEELTDTRKTDLSVPDFTPAVKESDLTELVRISETATPEQFQQALAVVFRKMMVQGLREIPPPRSIKELQAIYDMFRKAEGIEARDRGGGAPSGGFLPRVVGRRSLVSPSTDSGDTTVEFPPEVVDTVPAEEVPPIPQIDAADPLGGFEV